VRSRLNLDGINVPEDSGKLDPGEHQVGEEMKMREAHRPVAGRARSGVAAGNAHRPVQPPAPPHRAAQATAGLAGALVPVAAASRRAATGGEEEGGDKVGGRQGSGMPPRERRWRQRGGGWGEEERGEQAGQQAEAARRWRHINCGDAGREE
jgi:hypothetical protein